jgi:hypothetical protein
MLGVKGTRCAVAVTNETRPGEPGLALVRAVQEARKRMKQAETELGAARNAVEYSDSAFAAWIVPEGSKIGEVFCLPIYDVFLEVEIAAQRSFPVGGGIPSFNRDSSWRWRDGKEPEGPV